MTSTQQIVGIIGYIPKHFNQNCNCRIPAAYTVDVYVDDEKVMTVRAASINEAVWQATKEYPKIVIER